MSPRTGKYGRLRQTWEIVARDPLALTEIVSGLFLVALRGLLLTSGRILVPHSEVAVTLESIGVTEARWAAYLMICGILQIIFAPEDGHHPRRWTYRAIVAFAILFGFVVLTAGFWIVQGFRAIPASLICMSVFYTFMFGRVLADRRLYYEVLKREGC